MTTMGVIWNPTKVDEAELRTAIESVHAGEDVRWWETTEQDPGRGMAEEAVRVGCAVVYAAGGDGTVRAVAEALVDTDVALAIIPRGTGNLLARNLGVPLGDVRAAVEHAAAAEGHTIDVGEVRIIEGDDEGVHGFLVMVGLGLDAQMLAATDDDLKAKAGWLAYVQALGQAAAATELVGAQIALDDEESQDISVHTLLIGNCGMIQGGITLLPDAVPDDGLIDVLVISAEGVRGWLDTAKSLLWDNGLKRMLGGADEAVSTEFTSHASVTRVRVELDEPQQFEIDGEEVGAVRVFEVGVRAASLLVR
ncbi:diacylglycerol kinase family enzyme [Microbacterium keratanolyticum]|nr:diacylglycerol kinase family protein [Microbacterium keratanolyticum]MBM7467527.1 diacylglycerol kinase family enzyme [Microbacterium keratanolyticum]